MDVRDKIAGYSVRILMQELKQSKPHSKHHGSLKGLKNRDGMDAFL